MDLEGIMLKWNKLVRKIQISYDFTYMWNLKKRKNKQNWNRLIDTKTRLMVAKREGGWGTGWKDDGIKNYKLVVAKQSWECKVQHREYSQLCLITMYGVT